MSDEHRFSDQEIAAIFEQAAEAQETAQAGLSHGEGLTLEELQKIGVEAGISPEFIARASDSILRTGSAPPVATPLRSLGFPLTVERTVDLPGPLSDEDWDLLVTDLRETFRASGEVRQDGSLRQWRNGNLHAHVEPTKTGHRLRLWTRKGNATSGLIGGFASIAMGLMLLIIQIATGDISVNPESLFVGMLAAAGFGMIGVTRFTLKRWSVERAEQMEAIASRTIERMTAQAEEAVPEPVASPRLDLDSLPDVEDSVHEGERGRTRV